MFPDFSAYCLINQRVENDTSAKSLLNDRFQMYPLGGTSSLSTTGIPCSTKAEPNPEPTVTEMERPTLAAFPIQASPTPNAIASFKNRNSTPIWRPSKCRMRSETLIPYKL